MKVHLSQIPPEGLHLEGEEPGDFLDLHDAQPVRVLGPLVYTLDLGLSEGGLWAAGSLSMDLELQCVRCLEPFAYPLRVDDFAMQIELTGAETIDLTPMLREDILLALPAHPRCDWSGDKVCPVRLEARERGGPLDTGAEAGPSAAWQTLDQLKTPSK
jgi:uncharacterized protein